MLAIRILRLASMDKDPTHQLHEAAGKYIAKVDNVDDPWSWRFTSSLGEALKFDSFDAVMQLYYKQSSRMPLRPDGKANRPLRAFTVVVENI